MIFFPTSLQFKMRHLLPDNSVTFQFTHYIIHQKIKRNKEKVKEFFSFQTKT